MSDNHLSEGAAGLSQLEGEADICQAGGAFISPAAHRSPHKSDSSVCDALTGHNVDQSCSGSSLSPPHKKALEMVQSLWLLPHVSQDACADSLPLWSVKPVVLEKSQCHSNGSSPRQSHVTHIGVHRNISAQERRHVLVPLCGPHGSCPDKHNSCLCIIGSTLLGSLLPSSSCLTGCVRPSYRHTCQLGGILHLASELTPQEPFHPPQHFSWGMAVEDICTAASWASPCPFTCFYL